MTDKQKLDRMKKLSDAMYTAAQYLTTDASRLRKAMEEYHRFIITEYNKQEPVSEDLEKASEEYAYTNWESDDYHEGASEGKPFDAIGHTQKCFIDGAQWQKEQMMKDAISGIIFGSRYFRQKNISLTNLSEEQYDKLKDFGERIKVIIIKE